MATIWRPTYKASDGSRKRSRVWRIAYTDEHGKRRQISGYRDKQATTAYAAKLERDAERRQAGLTVISTEQLREPPPSVNFFDEADMPKRIKPMGHRTGLPRSRWVRRWPMVIRCAASAFPKLAFSGIGRAVRHWLPKPPSAQ